jgi:ABC-type glycerol-3-phosphate transport system permease component
VALPDPDRHPDADAVRVDALHVAQERRRRVRVPAHVHPEPFRWDNYSRLFEVLPFARFFLNSLVVAGSVTLLGVATSALAAYAFARLRFPGRDTLFLGYLGTLMIPAQVVIIPNFILLRSSVGSTPTRRSSSRRPSAPSAPSCCASTS